MNKDFNYSYWELKQYFSRYDLIVIGSGIVGLSTAINFQSERKKAKVLVLEKGIFPEGASTKNAGFACFGTAGEILDDLKIAGAEDSVWSTLKMRWEGLQLLRARLGDKTLKYKSFGGNELFFESSNYKTTLSEIKSLNQKINELTGIKNCYKTSSFSDLGFKGVKGMLHNRNEGQIDSGKMMNGLENIAQALGIRILHKIRVNRLMDTGRWVDLQTDAGIFQATQVVVATNGFAKELLNLPEVKPARAQVLITSPIHNLAIKGSFHFDKGFYYFRNVGKRILFGGGRNLDLKAEHTLNFGINQKIQNKLDEYLKNHLLPGKDFQIEQRWSGIMGMGREKKPILKKVSANVLAVVRMGGMGIAIGSKIAKLAEEELN